MDENKDPKVWVELYGDYLYRRALVLLGSPEAAEDLVQDTFLSAVQSQGSFRGESSIKTWLATILRNRAIDYMRKAVRREIPTSFSEPTEDENSDFTSWGIWTTPLDRKGIWEQSGYESLENQGFSEAILNCLEKLPSNQRNVLKLKIFEEMPISDICKELGLTASNVAVLLFRARLALRNCVDTNWYKKL